MADYNYRILNNKLRNINYSENTKVVSPYKYDNYFNIQWNNKKAIQRVYETIDRIKIEPTCINPNKGGMAIWLNLPTYTLTNEHRYWKFEIMDEGFLHSKPGMHYDFMHLTKTQYLDADKAKNLSEISDSIYYYQVGNKLTGACHFYSASLATFAVVKMYNDGRITLNQASNLYDKTVMDLIGEYTEAQNSGKFGEYDMPKHEAYEEYIFN